MDHTKFVLRVTAGAEYHKQEEVHVNTSRPIEINTADLSASIHVRVKDFRGLPRTSPSSSPYFSHPLHTSDRYSISFHFTPKATINGNDLVFGNDFDHPIRDRLPPGFGYAFNYVKSWIDPGLEGDPMAEEPWLYGPLLSSVNVLRVGRAKGEGRRDGGQEEGVDVVEEGASDAEGEEERERLGVPEDSKARMKFFLDEEKRKEFEFQRGKCYGCDFFNGFLDFNEFSLRLPLGFTMHIIKHWDGQPLRYVLRNRNTGALLFVVSFNLVPTDEGAREAAKAQASTEIAPVESLTNGEHSKENGKGGSVYVDEGVD